MQKRFLFFPVLFAGFFLLAGGAVMLLWNAILPDVTGFKPISFWQAVGLLALFRLLTGGFRRRGHGRPWRDRRAAMRNRWQHMTPEQREHFKAEWRRRCGRDN